MKKQQSIKYIILLLLIAVLVIPSVALASWWNPFSWGIWNTFFHKTTISIDTVIKKICSNDIGQKVSANRCGNIYKTYYNPPLADAPTSIYDLSGKFIGYCGGMSGPDGYDTANQKNCNLIKNCDAKDLCATEPSPIVGGDKDIHGCIGSAGYTWCATKNKCLRTWEEKCDTATDQTAGWKTYTNTQYGFSFQYPSDWEAVNTPQGQMGEFSLLSFNIIKNGIPYITIAVEDNNFVLGSRNWKDFQLGQIKGIISNSNEIVFTSAQGQKFYILTKNNPKMDTVTSQILSTFKFTK